MKFKRERIKNEVGLSLVELLAVIVILEILAAIAVPTYLSYIEKTTSEVCRVNRDTLKKDYSLFLMLNDEIHDEVQFKEYSQENGNDRCPVGGVYSYGSGDAGEEIHCNVHSDSNEEDEVDKEVPWL